MNQEINKYYFDIDNKANYIFFEMQKWFALYAFQFNMFIYSGVAAECP